MTTWEEEKEKEVRTLRDMATAVLPHLTGTWTMKDKVNLDGVVLGVMLTGSDGQEIDFRVPWNKPDRIEISGGFGNGLAQHLSYREDREKTSITVAAGKDPKRIAADIEKRLLPGYIRELKKAKERKQSADEYAANQRNVLERIQAAVGGGHIPDHTKETLYCSNFHGLTVKYYSGYDVRIEMNLPVEMLTEVIEFIKEKSKRRWNMENDWTRELDRLRAENARLENELALAYEKIKVREAWLQVQIAKIREARAGRGTG